MALTFLYLLLIIPCIYTATIEYCASNECVLLSDDDITHLLDESILTGHQAQYLHEHFSSSKRQIQPTNSEKERQNDANSERPESGTITDADAAKDITAYTVITSFLTTANLLYSIGCSILTISYLILLFWFRRDSPKILISLTLTYHYLFHIIADLLSQTISSRILSAVLYICCCNMPTIILFIYLFHPKLMNGYGALQETYEALKTVMVEQAQQIEGSSGTPRVTIPRKDIYFMQRIPTRIFLYCIAICLLSMTTPFVYSCIFGTQFIGIFAVFTAALYALLIIIGLFSLKSSLCNKIMSKISKSCSYGDCRCLYLSILYWISLFVMSYFTTNKMLRTVCCVSALNVFCWSFPLFLFVDVFQPPLVIDWNEVTRRITNSLIKDGVDCMLMVIQQNDIKYKSYILTLIALNWVMLQFCTLYSSWIGMSYSVISLFILSFAVRADNVKWSLSVHLPIACALFHASFVMLEVVDMPTLDALSWIAPSDILQWIIITILRVTTSFAASVQLTRAVHWMVIDYEKWVSLENVSSFDIGIHGATLYSVCCIFVRFTLLEPNGLIATLFEIFAIIFGIALVLSMGQILTTNKSPWAFFALNMMINLRCYVLSGYLVIPRIFAFLGTWVSFSLLNPKGMVDMYLPEETDANVLVLSACALYGAFGIGYDCKLLTFTSVMLMCAFVCLRVWLRTNSKRAAVAVLSVLAVILIRIGFKFETGFMRTFFGYPVDSGFHGGEPFEMYIIDKYLRNPFSMS